MHVIWGTLTVVFAVALWFGHQGARTDAGRIAVDLFAGGLGLLSLAAWIYFLRNPSELRITSETITLAHHGKGTTVVLHNRGELYIHRVRVGTQAAQQAFLKVQGADDAIPLQMFDWRKVQEACTATGWHIART